jgi:hypothetical protein
LSFIRYIRAHPFSIMALCGIVGDFGYVGFAFSAEGWVSLPKLAGSLFAVAAQLVLLAYGDDQARHLAEESGRLPLLILKLRKMARHLLRDLPENIESAARAKPVGIPFTMLSMNGIGLLTDAMLGPISAADALQIVLGACTTMGCGAYALADFVRGQKTANILLKVAPTILVGATLANGSLMLATDNGFLVFTFCVFSLHNFAGFCTKIDKDA